MESTKTHFRVLPWDIDAFGHLNNGRYLQIADVARVDWLRRTRILDTAVGNRWGAVLGGNFIRYCKVLRPFQKFSVTTRVLSWETRWIFIEHRFEDHNGNLVAIGYSRAALRSKRGWVTTKQITDAVVPGLESPEHSSIIKLWLAADDALVESTDFGHISKVQSPTPSIVKTEKFRASGFDENLSQRCVNY